MWIRVVLIVFAAGLAPRLTIAQAQAPIPHPPPTFGSLKGVPVPGPANLGDYVRDRAAAIVLGKALFWDTQVGSDGQACASCHFHAGADNRIKNQLNPGLLGGDSSFTAPLASSTGGGPNYTLKASDFPFHQLSDPTDRNSAVTYDTNDIASSQGAFDGAFVSVAPLILPDVCGAPDRATFQVRGTAVRKVEPRNTPTVINAGFNFRNFWDGRANNIFNGVSPFGRRDVTAHVLEAQPDGTLAPTAIELGNSSLASQAVGPALSSFEMSCLGRGFADLGKKMLTRIPLALQVVAPTDSVLGPFRHPINKGLILSYKQLVEQAFQPKYWNATQTVTIQAQQFSQEEANFSLFWGLAIQLYESTLVSDDAPIDRFFDGQASALTEQENRGFDIFQGKGHCAGCHDGPEFTGAASHLQAEAQEGGLVERMVMGDGNLAIYDNGFYNIGVRPTSEDRGVGEVDPFGNPLSFTSQFKQMLQGHDAPDPFQVDSCSFAVDPCVPVTGPNPREAVDGAFKVPSLRNVELTGPYFHNGGQATLEQVVNFYNRGGDRRGQDGNDTTGLGLNGSNLDADIQFLGLTTQEKADLLAFLKRPLTDERVRWEKAPFDHPELLIPNGHPVDETVVLDLNLDGKAEDTGLLIPAVGAGGRSILLGPLKPFLQ